MGGMASKKTKRSLYLELSNEILVIQRDCANLENEMAEALEKFREAGQFSTPSAKRASEDAIDSYFLTRVRYEAEKKKQRILVAKRNMELRRIARKRTFSSLPRRTRKRA